jgi:hypothetical protein
MQESRNWGAFRSSATLLYPFMFLSALGFLLSLVAHVVSICGLSIPDRIPVMDLHIGIFIVWFPAVLVAGRMTNSTNRKDFWKVALSGCPLWMRRSFYVIGGYALLNFAFFILRGGTRASGGEASPSIVWGFSGHWLAFYGAAFAILYSAIHAPQIMQKRYCSEGHLTSPSDDFCPKCGRSLTPTSQPFNLG